MEIVEKVRMIQLLDGMNDTETLKSKICPGSKTKVYALGELRPAATKDTGC